MYPLKCRDSNKWINLARLSQPTIREKGKSSKCLDSHFEFSEKIHREVVFSERMENVDLLLPMLLNLIFEQ